MNITLPSATTSFLKCIDCHATLKRLIGNLSGFLYRRRNDHRWTMDFVSPGIRDITGYDPHRFLANGSIAFANLIARSDWERVNERIRLAILRRRRATMRYLIRTAHGSWVRVEDRFTPVVNTAGKLVAIEGVVDWTRCSRPVAAGGPLPSDLQLPVPLSSPSLN